MSDLVAPGRAAASHARPSRVLMVYSTVDGHTLSICTRIRQRLQQQAHTVTLMSVDEALLHLDPASWDCVVIGASIRYGQHRHSVHEFVARHRALLARVPSAFFSVCAVARKPGKDTPEGNPYFRKFVQRSGWNPALAACFGGRIDYSKYGAVDRLMIRFIMWVTHGPTDTARAVEFTQWNAVDDFADRVGNSFQPIV